MHVQHRLLLQFIYILYTFYAYQSLLTLEDFNLLYIFHHCLRFVQLYSFSSYLTESTCSRLQDTRGSQAILGISFRGVSLFQEAKEVHKFDWSDIVRVGFSKKKFKIWFDASVQNPESVKPVLLELHLHNQAAAKRLWVVCAEQHTFFRYVCMYVCVRM